MKAYLAASFLALVLLPALALAKPTLSDAQIKKQLIKESIESYSGNCPCPYNTDRAGRSCGRRSAYIRPGGAAPLCYDKDVTAEMIQDWKSRQAE